jgi:hypothetical protein
MVLEFPEVTRERNVFGAGDVLIAENSTRYLSSRPRISATSSGSREATPRLTLLSSAPMAQVKGSTLSDPRDLICSGAVAVAVVMMESPDCLCFDS